MNVLIVRAVALRHGKAKKHHTGALHDHDEVETSSQNGSLKALHDEVETSSRIGSLNAHRAESYLSARKDVGFLLNATPDPTS